MQSLAWYCRRLKSMSHSEIVWRVGTLIRDNIDRCRYPLALYPDVGMAVRLDATEDCPSPGFSVSDLRPGAWAGPGPGSAEVAWQELLLARAARIVDHELSYFQLVDHSHGSPIDWHRDHGSGIATPRGSIQSIDYRDFAASGDCKLVWEPNRHHHLVVLGRAYRVSGDPRYALAIKEQLESWLDQNPFGYGMNWRSPLELGIRLINWVWTLDLIRDTGIFEGEFRTRLLHAVYLHLWDNSRKYSKGSSANNHLIGEAAGVFVAACYFEKMLNIDPKWIRESMAILEQEIINQTYPDGCTREHALGYQLFVLQFFLVCGLVARWSGREFSEGYWARLEKMLEFVGWLGEGGGSLPLFGDCDDGYVLDLGCHQHDPRGLFAIGAVLFNRPDFKSWAGGWQEPAEWLLGEKGRKDFHCIPGCQPDVNLVSRQLPESGYYLLQSGTQTGNDRVSVLFDCAELGYGAIAAHGHADALSFTLRAFGRDILVDPGTYDYFTYPEWRSYFRSTRAHNTVEIDSLDQSVMLGPFLWGGRAISRCLDFAENAHTVIVSGEHNGYNRLTDPVVHRRTLVLDIATGTLRIKDEFLMKKEHGIALLFHLHKDCTIQALGEHRFEIATDNGRLCLELDSCLEVALYNGSEKPRAGWMSPGYHRKEPTTTVVGRRQLFGEAEINCFVKIGQAGN